MANIALFNTILQQTVIVALAVDDPTDPVWNPPGCIQISLDEVDIASMTNKELYAYIASVT
jgi:hypothetical protein